MSSNDRLMAKVTALRKSRKDNSENLEKVCNIVLASRVMLGQIFVVLAPYLYRINGNSIRTDTPLFS